jgi:subtilisin family serine protease
VSKGLARRLFGAFRLILAMLPALGAATAANAWGRAARPRADSLEYQRSWGLEQVGAQAAYAAGYTGRGVRVALIDCGVSRRDANLGRNLSRDSADLNPLRAAHLDDRHGDWVAAPLGAALDGRGTVGLAYNATLLEIRADMDGGYKGECAFWPRDVARALDYAVKHKARIVTLPLQARRPLGSAFEAAMTRAVQAGVVVVIAAGNEAAIEPSWPARYALDPRFASAVVVAGAATFTGEFAPWSNRAGDAQGRYLLAPGEWILADCKARCGLASGTSFAAPFVAGALALVMEAHPELSGPQVADLVLTTARPLTSAGDPAVWGRGMLDLHRIFPATPAKTAAKN